MAARKTTEIQIDYKSVANILKCLVNSLCVDGFKWYPDANANIGVDMLSINKAIELLEAQDTLSIELVEDDQ